MPFGDLEVYLAMPRCNCHNTGTKLGINRLVFDNSGGYFAVNPLNFERITVLLLGVALVIRVHDDVLVAKLSLWPRRTNLEWSVSKGVELPFFLFVNYLVIR